MKPFCGRTGSGGARRTRVLQGFVGGILSRLGILQGGGGKQKKHCSGGGWWVCGLLDSNARTLFLDICNSMAWQKQGQHRQKNYDSPLDGPFLVTCGDEGLQYSAGSHFRSQQ